MESKDIKKYVAGACLAGLALAGLFYLSKDSDALDPKEHSNERMLKLLEELKLEYQCIYMRHFNSILKEKKNNNG